MDVKTADPEKEAYRLEDVPDVHNDFVPATPEEEAKLIRKLDWHLLPIIFVLYSLSVLDRSNLGNAKIAGMQKDIDLTGYRYNWLGTIFYIAYIASQWTILGWKHFKPHRWAACVVFFWGFIASIQAAVHNWGGEMSLRFLLGVAEAMFGPGVPLYLTFFYPREKVGFRHGVFISGSAAANAYGSALAYGISQIRGSLAPWRILFLIEGLPTCLIAILAWYYIPDSINDARFLNEREKAVATQFVARNQKLDEGNERKLRLKETLEAFKDPKAYIPGIMYFSCNVSFASLPLFVPTIISEIGAFTSIQSNGLSAPPYVLCFFFIIGMTFASDHFKMRGPFCAAAGLISAIGFIVLATTEGAGPRYFGVFLAVLIFASVALLLAWTSNIHATESKRAGGYTILATIGQCGPLLGTNMFPATEAPYYRKGMWIGAAFCLLVFFLSIALSLWLRYENQKLDRIEKGEESREHATSDVKMEKSFRYVW